jgi:hypothetical protein
LRLCASSEKFYLTLEAQRKIKERILERAFKIRTALNTASQPQEGF